MIFSILTLFPDMFRGPFDFSKIKHAKEQDIISINIINIRDFATDNYKTVDDRPYGGGIGMILKVDVVDRALQFAKNQFTEKSSHSILLDPQGTRFTQKEAVALTQKEHIILVCGHYEGVDARVRQLVDESISIGDFVVTGGELPAMTIVDAVTRLLPGVLRNETTITNETFMGEYREPPQYTRPAEYQGMKVPDILLGGNHAEIKKWNAQFSKATVGKKKTTK